MQNHIYAKVQYSIKIQEFLLHLQFLQFLHKIFILVLK